MGRCCDGGRIVLIRCCGARAMQMPHSSRAPAESAAGRSAVQQHHRYASLDTNAGNAGASSSGKLVASQPAQAPPSNIAPAAPEIIGQSSAPRHELPSTYNTPQRAGAYHHPSGASAMPTPADLHHQTNASFGVSSFDASEHAPADDLFDTQPLETRYASRAGASASDISYVPSELPSYREHDQSHSTGAGNAGFSHTFSDQGISLISQVRALRYATADTVGRWARLCSLLSFGMCGRHLHAYGAEPGPRSHAYASVGAPSLPLMRHR